MDCEFALKPFGAAKRSRVRYFLPNSFDSRELFLGKRRMALSESSTSRASSSNASCNVLCLPLVEVDLPFFVLRVAVAERAAPLGAGGFATTGCLCTPLVLVFGFGYRPLADGFGV